MIEKDFSIVTPEIEKLADMARLNSRIDPDLYDKYAVKRGLRDIKGNGVLTGLTEISEIIAKKPDEEGNLDVYKRQTVTRSEMRLISSIR